MRILAIESSCDETAAAVVEDGRKIISNIVFSQVDMHALYGGVVPEIASRKHVEVIDQVVQHALRDAGCSLSEIDAVAATAGPGLIGALLVGLNYAKSLAFASDKVFIPVHHIRGHIASNYLTHPDLEPPFICLTASGGHTMIVHVRDYTEMEVIGISRDDAAGECFDKISRVLGLGYPGGPAIDNAQAGGDDKKYPLPIAKVTDHAYDLSFSGVKTAAINTIHHAEQTGEKLDIPSFAASLCRAVSDALVPRVLEACRQYCLKKLAVCGGVSANSTIRSDLQKAAKEEGLSIYFPDMKLCSDNAAMIGSQAYYEYLAGKRGSTGQNAISNLDISEDISRIDE